MVSSRLPHDAYAALTRAAEARRMPIGEFIRVALQSILGGDSPSNDLQGVLAEVAAALGLENDAAPSDILAALQAVVDAAEGVPAEPGAPPSPAPPPLTNAQRDELARTAKARGETLEQFIRKALSAATGKPVPGERDPKSILADVATALGMPANAPGRDLLDTLRALVGETSPVASAVASTLGASSVFGASAALERLKPKADTHHVHNVTLGRALRAEVSRELVKLGARPAASGETLASLHGRLTALRAPTPKPAARVAPKASTKVARPAAPAHYGLTLNQRALARKHGMSPAEFAHRLQNVPLQRVGGPVDTRPKAPERDQWGNTWDEVALCRKRGIDPEEYAHRKSTMVRRG